MADSATGRSDKRASAPEPIAIVGMSGLFPDADNVDAFWDNVSRGRDSVADIPSDRGWRIDDYFDAKPQTRGKTYVRRAAFLKDIDRFDPLFFEISPGSAILMDPTARLFLQEAWRAIEDAGHSTASLSGTRCGMYFCAKGDYHTLLQRFEETYLASTDTYAPARLAYHLNLIGPAVSIDTACSSTLTALAYACDALTLGNCDIAIVGGGGLNATPNALVTSSQLLLFSPTGRCFTFDARADGTVLGEAVGVIVLKPLARAEADGDHIYGLVRGWGTNQDGRTNGQTAPSAKSQIRLETEIYERFGIDPADITLVEAHGTGTKLGDPIEVQALIESFRRFTKDKNYCALGSVKTNIGHTFFGAGVTSVIKVLQALRHGQIPPSLNFESINPAIKIAESPFYVNTALTPWERRNGKPRLAAVSAFGATGTNAHVLIEEYRGRAPANGAAPGFEAAVLSAKSEDRLAAQAANLLAHLRKGTVEPLCDIAHTLQVGRDAMTERLALVARDADELAAHLEAFLATDDKSQTREGAYYRGRIAGGALSRMEAAAALQNDVAEGIKARDGDALARLWVKGANIDWLKLRDGHQPRRARLPTYPFAGERYWVSQSLSDGYGAPAGKRKASVLHPLLHANVSSVDELGFTSTFTGEEFFLRDHLIRGTKILPGVAYLELARAAVARAFGAEDSTGPVRLEKVVWIQPFVFSPENDTVRIALAPMESRGKGERRVQFEIYGGEAGAEEAVVYCQGEAHFDPPAQPASLDLASLRRTCSEVELAASKLYPFLAASGFMLGPGHQGIETLFAGGGQALGRLVLPASVPDGFHLHPSLMDSALQTSTGLLFGEDAARREASVPLPFALDALDVYAPCTERMWAWVRHAGDGAPSEKMIRTDIDLCDDSGRVCVAMRGLTSRDLKKDLVAAQSGQAPAETVLLRPVWREAPQPEPAAAPAQRYVIYCADAPYLGTADLIEAHDGVAGVVPLLVSPDLPLAENFADAAASVFEAVKAALKRHGEKNAAREQIFVQLVVHPSAMESQVGALAGILKSAHQENSQFVGQTILFADDPGAHRIADNLDRDAGDPFAAEILHAQAKRFVRRQEEIAAAPDALPWREGGVYLLAGGAGGLGLILAREIASKCPGAALVLTGRTALDEKRASAMDCLRGEGATVEYHAVDLGDAEALSALVQDVVARHGALHGVFHCAGVLADGYVVKKSVDELSAVLAPKVAGLVNLDEATADCALDFFVGFSSLAGVWGNAGQSDYAAANAFMDAYLARRADAVAAGRRRGRSLAVNWPLWKDGGMRIDRVYEEQMANATGFVALPSETGIAAFYRALGADGAQIMVVHADREKWLKSQERRVKALAARAAPRAEAGEADTGLHGEIVTLIRTLIADLIRADVAQIDPQAELSEFGLDSITLTRLSNLLHDEYEISLSPTIFFEYSTINEFGHLLADVYADELRPRLKEGAPRLPAVDANGIAIRREAPSAANGQARRRRFRAAFRLDAEPQPSLPRPTVVPARSDETRAREPIAIIGMSAHFPMARTYREFWRNLSEGRDCITEIPPDRWDWRAIYGDPHEKAEVTNIKWGGFIDGIGDWDPAFFSISPREAELIDPQKRLLMTHVWKAIEDAGYAPSALWGSNTALYIGTADSGYASLYAQAGLKTDGSGTPTSMGPNRMSYFLNLHGPSEPVETACSSSLIAINRGVTAIRCGLCDLAVAGGIQLIPTPAKHISFSQAGILCEDGRCKTFSSKANGYVRSEGIGMVVLKRLSEAEKAGDAIYGIILGIAENHGGRANSLTSPNPRAQAQLLQAAYRDARIDPRSVTYIEAHGTGTNLGDPIEVNALKAAFRQLYDETDDRQTVYREPGEVHCGLGSVKTNIGHAELAAGVAGVIKVLLQMRHKTLVKSLHCDELNPHIDFSGSPFEVVREKREWKRAVDRQGNPVPRRAGVSSFGVGGVNAHVVLEEYA